MSYDFELDRQLEEIANVTIEHDMDFIMSFGDDLCIDGHFPKEHLILLAKKILEVFHEA